MVIEYARNIFKGRIDTLFRLEILRICRVRIVDVAELMNLTGIETISSCPAIDLIQDERQGSTKIETKKEGIF